VVPVVTTPARKPPRTDYWLRRDQVAARLKAARADKRSRHLARFILIGVTTGTRPGAILRLQWLPSPSGGWFDLETRTLHRRGLGAKESRKRQPPVRIPDKLLPHLRRWRAADLAAGISSVIHDGGRPVASIKRAWAGAAGRAGEGRYLKEQGRYKGPDGPHIVRHTAATWMMQRGVPAEEAAGYLGMTLKTLWEVYGHHHPDFQRMAAGSRR